MQVCYSIVWKVREALTRARAVMADIGISFGANEGLKLARQTMPGVSDLRMYLTAV